MSSNYSRKTTSLVGVSSGPVPAQALVGDALTYEPFFGLNEKPFSLDSDPRFLYASPTHDATRKGLLSSIRRREGLLVLTGEIGTGKTTLCRTVIRELGRNTWSSLVPDPFAAREDLLKMLLIDFGVLSIDDVTEGNLRHASRTELGYLLSDFLNTLSRDAFAVVIIDEAQNLSLPLIEETRILFDSFGASGKLQILFVGQPELHAKLKLPEMRQVDQRICGYYRLGPMNADAVAGYIAHRLHVAGAPRDRVLFPPTMIAALHKRTGGVPRLINRVCDRALQLAYEQRSRAVSQEMFDAALIEIGAVTLSPTWDSIMFADGPAKPPASTPASSAMAVPFPTRTPSPAPVIVAPVIQPIPSGGMDFFEKELAPAEPQSNLDSARNIDVDAEAQQVLEPPSGALSPLFQGLEPLAEPQDSVSDDGSNAPSATPSRARIDWPRDIRSDTHTQNVTRTWARQGAIALAVFVVANIAFAGAVSLLGNWQRPVLPALPSTPAKVLPSLELPEAIGQPAMGVVFVGDDASAIEAVIGTP